MSSKDMAKNFLTSKHRLTSSQEEFYIFEMRFSPNHVVKKYVARAAASKDKDDAINWEQEIPFQKTSAREGARQRAMMPIKPDSNRSSSDKYPPTKEMLDEK